VYRLLPSSNWVSASNYAQQLKRVSHSGVKGQHGRKSPSSGSTGTNVSFPILIHCSSLTRPASAAVDSPLASPDVGHGVPDLPHPDQHVCQHAVHTRWARRMALVALRHLSSLVHVRHHASFNQIELFFRPQIGGSLGASVYSWAMRSAEKSSLHAVSWITRVKSKWLAFALAVMALTVVISLPIILVVKLVE